MEINLIPIMNFFDLPLDQMAWRIFILVGWIPIGIIFLWGAKEIWLVYIRRQWGKDIKYIILAIDIPRNNQQSPKAVENLFSYLAGAHSGPDLIEKYWDGHFQLSFSFEIVSIEGYIQFLVHTPEKHRNLVESAIYSQYPDAEITEVSDYTDTVPRRYPDDEYDLWGGEYILAKPMAFPIKTYPEFEHQFGPPETTYKDPMSALLDLYSSLGKGEQAWYQIILIPIGFDWPEIGDKQISKILKEKTGSSSLFGDLGGGISEWIELFRSAIFGGEAGREESKKEDTALKMLNLKPKEKKQVESIQHKVSKVGFECKIRFVYVARREVFNKPKVSNGFTGYMKQFADTDTNNLKPDMDKTITKAKYFFKHYEVNRRKNSVIRNYIARDDFAGRQPYIMNIEELASIWHFPIEAVARAPLLQKAPGRKAEPPAVLPTTEETEAEKYLEPVFKTAAAKKSEPAAAPAAAEDLPFASAAAEKKAAPPDNLPVA